MERPTILIDTREQRPLAFSDDVDTEIVGLPTGDYSLRGFTDHIVIERKSLPDLWSCCGAERERFEAELARLRAYPLRAVIVEATIDAVLGTIPRGRVQPATVVRSTIAWQADHGVPFIWAGNPTNAAAWTEFALLRVARKASRERAA